MRFRFILFEERILLDAAGTTQIVNSYDMESSLGNSDSYDQTMSTDTPGAVHANSDAVDGRVLVVSSQINDLSIFADAANENVTVITYDFNTSLADLSQSIADALTGKEATSIGFALMGADGKFSLTSDVLVSLQNLDENVELQSFWKSIGGMVQNGGSIDILSCDVGKDAEGLLLIHRLDDLIDSEENGHFVSINASSDKTGSSDLGGNWILEIGNVNALDRYFDSTALSDWHGILDAPYRVLNINSGSSSSNPSQFTEVGTITYFTATTSSAGEELWRTDGTAGGTYMVRDIVSGSSGSSITNLTEYNGNLYFIATVSGDTSLWRSDGTSGGTVKVSTTINSSGDDAVGNLTKVGSSLFFSATNAANGNELWKSDGTAAGTVFLKDINPGSGNSSPSDFTEVNGKLFFSANNGAATRAIQLWVSDGTASGTFRLTIMETDGKADPFTDLTDINGILYFSGNAASRQEPWRSDGTIPGTYLIKDINPNVAGASLPSNFVSLNSLVYFTAANPDFGTELWVTDGTLDGTTMVKDINPGASGSSIDSLVVAGGKIFFSANDGVNGTEIWISDGTTVGTTMLKNIVSGSGSSDPTSLVAFGNNVYFVAASTAGGTELWQTDGTAIGTIQVLDIRAGSSSSSPVNLAISGTNLYFSANDGSTGSELWAYNVNSRPVGIAHSYDGAENRTLIVNEENGLLNGATDADGNNLSAIVVSGPTKGTLTLNPNGSFTYVPNVDSNGIDTFTYRVNDGFANSLGVYTVTLNIEALDDPIAKLIANINPGMANSSPANFTQVGSLVYFTASTLTGGTELWVTDKTTAGTVLVKDIVPGSGGSAIANMTELDGLLYFTATVGSETSLWRSNGTSAGTVQIKNINASGDDAVSSLTKVGSSLLFSATTSSGAELWISDGTSAGTVLLKDINVGAAGSSPNLIFDANGTAYFTANDGSTGVELWKSDGTAAGTVLVKDINSGSGDSSIANMQFFDGKLYFSANDGINGSELWVSDGTTAGTVMLANINGGSASSTPANLTVMGSSLFFTATTSSQGLELWKTDGTLAGTVLVKDIRTGSPDSTPTSLVSTGSKLFFAANDGTNGIELWVSDGTTAGTVMVQNINTTSSSSSPGFLQVIGDKVYFAATDAAAGRELWMSDGTPGGTVLIANINPGAANSNPAGLTAIGNDLYFRANNPSVGIELWSYHVNALPTGENKSYSATEDTTLVVNAATGVLNGAVDLEGNPLTAELVTNGSKGVVTLNDDGSFTYVPNLNQNGTDSFTYRIFDGYGYSQDYTVDLSITGVNDAPFIGNITRIADINPGLESSVPDNITQVGSLIYFTATTAANGTELWVTDGTNLGTRMVKDISFGQSSSSPYQLVNFNGTLYFIAQVGGERSLWKTDGTEAGTVQVKDIYVGGNDEVSELINATTSLFIVARTAANGAELWKSDGTTAGTVMVKDIFPGSSDSNINSMQALPNGKVMFNAAESVSSEARPWISDGTSAGTFSTSSAALRPYGNFSVLNGYAYYGASGTGLGGAELWRTNITTGVSNLVKDIWVGGGAVPGADFYVFQNKLYFPATTGSGRELWTSDGTSAGTVLVKDINVGSGDSISGGGAFTEAGGKLFFSANNGVDGFELWVTDGTTAGTVMVKNIDGGAGDGRPNDIVAIGSKVYFAATDAAGNRELWVSDGTSAGTFRVVDILPGSGSSNPINMQVIDGVIYFGANDGTTGIELWKYDPAADATLYFTGAEDTPLAVSAPGLLSAGADPDNDSLTAILETNPTNGTLLLNPDGSFTYTPNSNFFGTDSFTYRVSDGNLTSEINTVNITITSVNDAPVGLPKSYTATEDTTLTVNAAGGVVTGATDVEGNTPFTAQLVTNGSKGTVTLNSNGSFTYVPNANAFGADSFTYRLIDSLGAISAPLTANITINSVNDAPVAQNGVRTTNEDEAVSGTAVATDVDLDTLTYSIVTGPANGSININPLTGAYIYTPNLNYNGPDSFTFRVNDGTVNSNTATINITVSPVNDAPVANSTSASTNEDTPLSASVSATDIDSGVLTYTLLSGPTNGSIIFNSNGTYTYTPASNFNGSDSFTFRANDGSLNSNTATVNLTINPVNDAPVANSSSVNVVSNGTVNDVVSYTDIDSPSGSVTASLVSGPSNGVLILNPDRTYSYTPDLNYVGPDSFTFTVNDGEFTSNVQTVNINVFLGGDPPIAYAGSDSTDEDTPLNGTVTVTDNDTPLSSVTTILVSGPSNGSLIFNTDGTYTYTPNANFNGIDSFTFKANDGLLDSNVETMTITVNPINDAPEAFDDAINVNEDSVANGTVLMSDIDTNIGSLTASVVTGPSNGILNLNPDGTYSYTPNSNFNGTDSFTFKVNDGSLDSATRTVSITINAVNDAPVAVDTTDSVDEDAILSGSVAGAVSDIDLDALTFNLISGPAHGSITFNPDGTYTYTPDPDFNGTDTFTFNGSDGLLLSETKTVTITVNPVNDAPIAQDVSDNVDEDNTLNGDLSAAATDIDLDPLVFSVVSGPSNGVLNLNPDGTYSYTPNSNFNGSDSFTYKVSDGFVDSATQTVTITVNAVNDAPVAENIDVSVNEDASLSDTVAGAVTDVDFDPLTFNLISGPANGNLTFNPDGSYTYTPDPDFNGFDEFSFNATDGLLFSETKTVSITVNPTNDAPIAQDVSTSVDEDVTLNGDLSSAVTDIDLDPISFSVVSGPSNGILNLNPDGTYSYTPNANFNGTDSFTFIGNDGSLDTLVRTVTITVNAINDAPVAVDVLTSVNEDEQLSATVAGGVSDVELDPLSFNLISGPAHGILTFNPDGTFTYTPNADFNGTDTFSFNASDGQLLSETKSVIITINPVNDAPITQDGLIEGVEDTKLTGNVPWSDIDNNSITAVLVSGPANGVLVLNPNGSFEYTPSLDFTGVDNFTFYVTDGQANSQISQITVVVNAGAEQVATPPPVPETPPVNALPNPITPIVLPPVLPDTPVELPPSITPTDNETPGQESGNLDERTITVISNGNIVTRPLEEAENQEPIRKEKSAQDDSDDYLHGESKDGRKTIPLQALTLDGLLFISKDMLNVATIRGSTLWDDENLTKVLLLIGPLVDRIDYCAKQNLGDLIRSQRVVRPLTNRKKIRKFALISNLLETLDLSFSRETRKAISKESLKTSQKAHLKSGVDISGYGEEYLQTYLKGLHTITQTQFPKEQFGEKEALAVELLTKYIVSQNLPNDFSFPFPVLKADGNEMIAHYHLTKKFSLGNSEIPVYLFESIEENLNPLLVFRGSRMNFDNVSNINSLVENFNVQGPARGYYKEFTPELALFFQDWFTKPQHARLFRIFGYSQGGVLGQRTVVDFSEFVGRTPAERSIFFNSPGVEADYLEKWNAINPEKHPNVVNYVVTRDAVSKVGAGFIGDVYEISPKQSNKITEAHFGTKFLDDDWKTYKIHNERESESATRRILNAIQASVVTNGVYHIAQLHATLVSGGARKFVASPSITTPGKNISLLRHVNHPTHLFDVYQKGATLPIETNSTGPFSEVNYDKIVHNSRINKDEKPLLDKARSSTLNLEKSAIEKPIKSRRDYFYDFEKGAYSKLDIAAAIFAIKYDLRNQLSESPEASSANLLQAIKEEEDTEHWK